MAIESTADQDYNYNIDFGGSGDNANTSGIIASSDVKVSSGGVGGTGGGKTMNNPLLASVHTQGSLKGDNAAQKRGVGAKGSGLSKGSHNGSAINI